MDAKEIEELQVRLKKQGEEIAGLKGRIEELMTYKMRCCQLDLQAVLDKFDVNLSPQTNMALTPRK